MCKKNHLAGPHEDALAEAFELFVCQICLDIVYKPIVLQACGHVFCFWCVRRAMNKMKPSQCPACRQAYLHFPRICHLLHFLLGKLWPEDYARKESETLAMEQASEIASPKISPLVSSTPHSSKDNHQTVSTMKPKLHVYPERYVEDDSSIVIKRKESITTEDAMCRACRKLLYRPVVLNCGEVLCESCCIAERQDVQEGASGLTPANPAGCCSWCGTLHPSSAPLAVCLPLHQLLECTFPLLYAQRRDETECLLTSTTSSTVSDPGEQRRLSEEEDNEEEFREEDNSFVHIGTGCDGCGMFPILGRHHYHCLDCSERVGYDLCQNCYQNVSSDRCRSRLQKDDGIGSSSYTSSPTSVLSGRFSQQHSAEHRMEERVSTHRPRPAASFNAVIQFLRINASPVEFDLSNATIQSRRRTRQQILNDFDEYIDSFV